MHGRFNMLDPILCLKPPNECCTLWDPDSLEVGPLALQFFSALGSWPLLPAMRPTHLHPAKTLCGLQASHISARACRVCLTYGGFCGKGHDALDLVHVTLSAGALFSTRASTIWHQLLGESTGCGLQESQYVLRVDGCNA